MRSSGLIGHCICMHCSDWRTHLHLLTCYNSRLEQHVDKCSAAQCWYITDECMLKDYLYLLYMHMYSLHSVRLAQLNMGARACLRYMHSVKQQLSYYILQSKSVVVQVQVLLLIIW